MPDIDIYDNFLDIDTFEKIQKMCLSDIDWKYDDTVANRFSSQINCEEKYNWQMVHIFYNHPFNISSSFQIINPIVQKINPIVMYRAKLNLNPSTDKIVEHGYHQDYQPEEDGKIFTSSIFYLNSNNGYTKFEDGTQVESVENRLVTFPSTLMHTGSSCTDSKNRLVLNLVFVKKDRIV
jgi:hypothetical protein